MSPRLPLKPLSLQALVAAYESAKTSPSWQTSPDVRKGTPAAVWNALVVRGFVTLTDSALFVTPLGRLVVEAQGYIANMAAVASEQIVTTASNLAPQMGISPLEVANAIVAEFERALVDQVERRLGT